MRSGRSYHTEASLLSTSAGDCPRSDRPIDRSRSSAAEWIGRSDRRWWRWEVAWHHGDWMFNDEWVLLIRLFVLWLVASTYVLCLAYYNTTVSGTLGVSIEWCVVECREVWLKSRGLFLVICHLSTRVAH